MVGASEAAQGQESARWQGCEPQVGAGRERVGHGQGRRAGQWWARRWTELRMVGAGLAWATANESK